MTSVYDVFRTRIGLFFWRLMALSAQIGYIVPWEYESHRAVGLHKHIIGVQSDNETTQ